MLARSLILACCLVALGTSQAAASGVLSGFTLTPTSTQAGGNPDVTADLRFDYGVGNTTDSVRSVTIDLPPGLLASIANVPATCSLDQLSAGVCPVGSQIGSGTVTANRTLLDTGLYLMPPPSPGDAAGFGTVVFAGGSAYTGVGTLDVVSGPGGQAVGEVKLGVPVVSGEQVFELRATMNGTLAGGQPFTRLPTSCATATTSASVETVETGPGAGAGTDSFVPTGCSTLAYGPALSSVQVIKDPGDSGAELVASISQPNAAAESATKALELDWPASLTPIAAPAAACLSGTSCKIGTARATSPLAPPSYLSDGAVTLGGTPQAPTLTIAFPAPVPLSVTGAIDVATGTIAFASVPDFPFSALTVDIAGVPGGARVLSTTCAPGSLVAKLTPQSGGAVATSAQPIAYQGCPRVTPPPPRRRRSAPLRVSIRSRRSLVVRGRASARLACRGGAAGSACRGTLSLTVRKRIVRHVHRHRTTIHRTIVLARVRYAVAGGHTQAVTLPLTHAGLRLLASARHHRLRVRATATLRGGATAHRTIVVRLTSPTSTASS